MTALILELRRLSRERGAYVIFIQKDHGDEPAIEPYTRLGTPRGRPPLRHSRLSPEGVHMPRDNWNTRIGYILAMVGSAVGLGNTDGTGRFLQRITLGRLCATRPS